MAGETGITFRMPEVREEDEAAFPLAAAAIGPLGFGLGTFAPPPFTAAIRALHPPKTLDISLFFLTLLSLFLFAPFPHSLNL